MVLCSKGGDSMQYMNKVFYNMGPQEREAKRQGRISYDSALLPNLKIMPMNQARAFSLYYIPTMRTLDLIGHISRSDIVLDEFYKKLPAVAQKNFFVDSFLHLLHSGQESLIDSLQIKANLLDAALEKIQKDPRLDADLRLMMEALSLDMQRGKRLLPSLYFYFVLLSAFCFPLLTFCF